MCIQTQTKKRGPGHPTNSSERRAPQRALHHEILDTARKHPYMYVHTCMPAHASPSHTHTTQYHTPLIPRASAHSHLTKLGSHFSSADPLHMCTVLYLAQAARCVHGYKSSGARPSWRCHAFIPSIIPPHCLTSRPASSLVSSWCSKVQS